MTSRALIAASLLLITASPAVAEVAVTESNKLPIAIAANLPFRWEGAGSVAGSVYVGLSNKHAVRGNVATYEYTPNAARSLLVVAQGGEGVEGKFSGRTTDVGVGLVYFPRRLWSGFACETGVLVRDRDLRLGTPWTTPDLTDTNTTAVAGRLMVGWSWLMYERVFLAFGVGFSMGYERGTEWTEDTEAGMRTTNDVSRANLDGEAYLRIGGAFDL